MKRVSLMTIVALQACATTAPRQVPPPSSPTIPVEITVKDLDANLLRELQDALAKSSSLSSAKVTSTGPKTAVIALMYQGELSHLPEMLSTLERPGLRFASAKHLVEYSAFDNQPPAVAFIHPRNEQLLAQREQFVTVEAPDGDVKEVLIGGRQAQLFKPGIYRVRLQLNEGAQQLQAIARDKAGNESSAMVAITVDTTPPAVNAQVKLLIEGTAEPGSTVLIEGQEVPLGADGSYRAEVPVRKGQKRVEIVAIDRSGNKTVSNKTIGD